MDVRNRARIFHEAIRRALLNEWDPIGVSEFAEAQDEYDSYVPAIYKMLIARKPQDEIFEYLWWLETEHMGLIGDRQATETFAGRLMQIPDEVKKAVAQPLSIPPSSTGPKAAPVGGVAIDSGAMAMTEGLVKVHFILDPADWHGCSSETLWARRLSVAEEGSALEIQNSPFCANGVSFLDVVRGMKRNGQYEFVGTVSSGGHSTYRLLVDRNSVAFDLWWDRLKELGCSYESGDFNDKKLLTVDVPPESNIYAVYALLEDGERQHIWMFEEAHVAEANKDFDNLRPTNVQK